MKTKISEGQYEDFANSSITELKKLWLLTNQRLSEFENNEFAISENASEIIDSLTDSEVALALQVSAMRSSSVIDIAAKLELWRMGRDYPADPDPESLESVYDALAVSALKDLERMTAGNRSG